MIKQWTTAASTEIYQVQKGRINSYLICHKNGKILVDSGLNRLTKKLVRNINSIIAKNDKIDYLVATHTHFDHCQNFSFVSKKFNSKIIVHSSEAFNLLSGQTQIPYGTFFLSKLFFSIAKLFGNKVVKIPEAEPDILVKEIMAPFGNNSIPILHTPGHSPGSMCLIIDDEIAIAGDAVFGVFPNRAFPPFADDVPELIESWGTLLETNCKIFLPGHGKPVSRKTLEKEFQNRSI